MKSRVSLLSCLIFAVMLLSSGAPLVAAEYLEIDKNSMTIALIQDGDTLMKFPISCGRGFGQKQKEGDMRTPEGTFKVTQITDASAWGHDFGDGYGYIKHAYGPWFIRLSAGHGVGIHGTHDPGSMGYRASEGCIRLRNEDLLRLKPRVFKGMKVIITPDTFTMLPCPKLKARLQLQPTVDRLEPSVARWKPEIKPVSVNTILHIGRKKSKK